MSSWGMGITQSDEYCDIYERFMEEYDEGKPLLDIKTDILEENLDEFDKNDGVLQIAVLIENALCSWNPG